MNPSQFQLHRFALILLLLMGVTSAPAQERPLSTEQLTAGADVVVVGKVEGMKSSWSPDRKRIVTTVRIAVDQTLKGEGTGSTVSVVVPGGEVDGVGEWYSHTARFRKDEEVVVFTKKDGEGKLRVTGGSQGKLSVSRDLEKGVALVGGAQTLDQFTATVRKAATIQEGPHDN